MKITTHKKFGSSYKKFNGKYVKGLIYDTDGSGELIVKSPSGYVRCGDYCEDSGTHKHRVDDIKKLSELYFNAYKELLELEKKL